MANFGSLKDAKFRKMNAGQQGTVIAGTHSLTVAGCLSEGWFNNKYES